jgi:hypothetical protein
MSGYIDIRRIHRIEKEVDELGMVLCQPKHRDYHNENLVSVKPKDQNSLPIYNRDAELFIGTLEDLDIWLRGIMWAREYDHMIKLSTTEKRQRKEQDILNKQLVQRLKNEKLELRDK